MNVFCHSLLACRVYAERPAVNCMGFPLYVTSCFSLAAFNILSLCLISASLISTCFDRFSLGFILYRTHCAPWIEYFLSHAGEVFNCNCLKNFLSDFLFLFFPCDPYNSNVVAFILSKCLRLSSILFILFPLFCCLTAISTILSSSSLIYSSASVNLLLLPSIIF